MGNRRSEPTLKSESSPEQISKGCVHKKWSVLGAADDESQLGRDHRARDCVLVPCEDRSWGRHLKMRCLNVFRFAIVFVEMIIVVMDISEIGNTSPSPTIAFVLAFQCHKSTWK